MALAIALFCMFTSGLAFGFLIGERVKKEERDGLEFLSEATKLALADWDRAKEEYDKKYGSELGFKGDEG